jgi:mRNA interferase MazF
MAASERGEILLIDWGMAAKMRPALVLSVPIQDHERALVTYVPRTTALRGTRFEVKHVARGFDLGAFDAQGIGSIPHTKLIRRLGVIDTATMQSVERAICLWLGIPS